MLPLKHPFTALVVGPTCCGKTQFVFKFIDNVDRMIDPPPNRIVYCYGEYQKSFRKYSNVEFPKVYRTRPTLTEASPYC